MSFFKVLNKLEDAVRRGNLFKSTDKAGVPVVLGNDEDTVETTQCNSNELVSAMGVKKAAATGGFALKNTTSEVVTDSEDIEKAVPKKRLSQKDKLAQARKQKTGRALSFADKKAAKGRKATKTQKVKAKKMGKSGEGTGQAGRTKPRKRRGVGEFWWAPSGFHEGAAAGRDSLWTKRKDGAIVRANREEQKKYRKLVGEKGVKDKKEYEVEDEHKRRKAYVDKIKQAKGLSEHLTTEARAEILKSLKQAGFRLTEKEDKYLDRILDELCAYKLSLGQPSKWARKPDQVRRDFLDGMDPQNYKDMKEFNRTKQRFEKMSVAEFDLALRAIMFDEDEDVLRSDYDIQGKWKAAKSFDDNLSDILKSFGV